VPDPGARPPGAGPPAAGSPGAGLPGATAPAAGPPDAARPGATAPAAGSPDAARPGATAPAAGSPGAGPPGAGSPNAAPPGAARPGAGSPTAVPPGAGGPAAEPPAAEPPGLAPPATARPPRRGGTDPWRSAALAPAIVLFVGLSVLPILNLVAMSFHEVTWVQARAHWEPVGAKHFQALPDDQLFRAGLANTLLFAVSAVTLQMLLGGLLALCTSRIRTGRVLYRAVFVLPILVPGIVIGAIWKLMYNFDFGVINQLAGLVGLLPRDWLGDKRTALLGVILVDVWHWTPFCFLLLLAGLESLSREISEAARVDGAGFWTELRHVTLPLMLPTILVTLAFRLILAFKVFDEVFLLTGGGPGTATEVISFTIYRRFFTEDRVGHGSALSIVTLLVVALLIVVALGAARRRGATG
jgi:multiple sugar transport system permease protein